MKRPNLSACCLTVLSLADVSHSQDPFPRARVICDVADPQYGCPGQDCICADDTLEITFDPDGKSVYQYDEYDSQSLDVTVSTQTVSPGVEGWSFGVQHDPSALSLISATVDDTDADVALNQGFVNLRTSDIQVCGTDLECTEANRKSATGWTCAVVLSFKGSYVLPLKPNSIAKAQYRLEQDVGGLGTLIKLTDRLAVVGGPAVEFMLWVSDKAKKWTTAVDGFIRRSDSHEQLQLLCDATDAKNKCPGADCVCLEDAIELVFDGHRDTIYEYETFDRDESFDATVVAETRTSGIQGWTFGVQHDEEALDIEEVTVAGTRAEAAQMGGFVSITKDVQVCGDLPCARENRIDGGGWIEAIVLSFKQQLTLPLQRNAIGKARYSLRQDVGKSGTLIWFSDRLAVPNSPRVEFNWTADGRSRRWTYGVSGMVRRADPRERIRVICDAEYRDASCPGKNCECVEDSIEVTFRGDRDSVFEYDAFKPGMQVDAEVVMETRSLAVEGWSYGVRHDPAALKVDAATIAGTDAEVAEVDGFVALRIGDVQTCRDWNCAQDNRIAGGGWISATLLSYKRPVSLALGRRTIAKANYTLLKDVGQRGTFIEVTDQLAVQGSPSVGLNLTIDGKSRRWGTTIDGWVKRAPCATDLPFLRGDVGMNRPGEEHPADGTVNVTDPIRILTWLFLGGGYALECKKAADIDDSGLIEITDAIYLLRFLFLGGSEPQAPFPAPALDPSPDELTCCSYTLCREE